MRRSALYTSGFLHVFMLLVAIFGLPHLARRFELPPPPITVELVEVSKITQTVQVAPPKPPEEKPPEPEKPKPAPRNTAQAPVQPVKEPPKPETKPVKQEPQPQEDDKNALPEKKKPEPKKQEPPKPQAPQRDFSSVLKNLDVDKKPPPPAPAAAQAPVGEKLTMSEEDALRAQLENCWNVPYGAKDAENLVIEIHMIVNPDRTLRQAQIVDTSRYDSDPFFRAAADSALRAVRSPLCSPFDLPPDKYDTWNTITVTFNPKDMF